MKLVLASVFRNRMAVLTAACLGFPVLAHAQAPVITTQPQNVAALVGDSVTFSVTATGADPLSYSWALSPTSTSNGTASLWDGTVDRTQATITIPSVRAADNGGYSVTVSNAYGRAHSQLGWLTVCGFYKQPFAAASIGVGAPFGLRAFAVSGTLQWYKDGTAIPGGTTSYLDFPNPQVSDSGTYSCVNQSALGPITSSSSVITVFTPPAFSGGDGSLGNPYQIANADQLEGIRGNLDKAFVLTADIDLAGRVFIPIGDNTVPFTGTFNGNGHTIRNWEYDDWTYSVSWLSMPPLIRVGFFRMLSNTATVANLHLVNCSLRSPEVGGILTAESAGTITNWTSTRVIRGIITGGLVGANLGSISGCATDVSVRSISSPADPYYGVNINSYSRNSYSDGCGGLVSYNGGTLSDCFAQGPVNGGGGLVNLNDPTGTVVRCFATGAVSGSRFAGGLIGRSFGAVDQCYATGSVTGSWIVQMGGLVGEGGAVSNSFSRGGLFADQTMSWYWYQSSVGGLVGRNAKSISSSYTVSTYNFPGSFVGYPGGLVGGTNWVSGYPDSFWDAETSGFWSSSGGTGHSIAELTDPSTYTDWDFSTVWQMTPGEFPTLRNNPLVTLTGISPQSATIGSATGFTLTVTGTGFAPSCQVEWNGAVRPTTFVDSHTLTAAIPASDLAINGDVSAALVDVLCPTGARSGSTIVSMARNVTAAQSVCVTAGTSSSATTLSQDAPAGVSASLFANGPTDSALTVANYASDPTGTPYIDVGGQYVDIQVNGASSADVLASQFYYPNTITGQTETDLGLLFNDGTGWRPVLSSGGNAPAKDTTDNLDGTASGGRFTVTFDSTSTPKVTELTGTVFIQSTPDRTPPKIKSVTASPSNLGPPNHKLIPVKIIVDAKDDIDLHPIAKILSVTANEPINGRGDGNTAVDYQITGDLTLNLRSERSGTGKAGRIYTITVQIADHSGNKTVGTVTVTVPKS